MIRSFKARDLSNHRPRCRHQHKLDRTAIVSSVSVLTLSILLIILLFRVLQLQLRPDEQITNLLDNQVSHSSVMARRGNLTDRHGRVLACSRVAYRLFVDPALIIDRNTFSERAGYFLDYDPAWFEKRIAERRSNRYVVIDQKLDEDRLQLFRQMDLPGLSVEQYVTRDYPQDSLAAHLLGFVGRDGYGLEGLERLYNTRLLENIGDVSYLRDARRRIMWANYESYRPQHNGQNIRLTIDITIQAYAERYLAQAVDQYGGESGQMVVMSPQTGEILAMANYPGFDPNMYQRSTASTRRNRVVTDVFEPGSIFKPIVWSGLTDAGVISPNEMLDCTDSGVYHTKRGRILRDTHGHGRISWTDVLVKSSNIGMAIGAQRTDMESLHAIICRFGFGNSTCSGLPGEVTGIVNPLNQWNHYSQTSIPMGQEIAVTALQMTRAFCAIANDGLLIQPTIAYTDYHETGHGIIEERAISTETARLCRQVLSVAVQDGTGRRASSKLYTIFGKTGTAQLPDLKNGGYLEGQYVSSFIAGAPLEKPALVIGCFIHKPDKSKGYYGGIVAAPVVKETMEQALLYLGLAPSQF